MARGLIKKRSIDDAGETPGEYIRQWARGDTTLREIKNYTAEELYHIAQHGYTLYLNGKFKDAQVVFEGLVALDPKSEYYYRALGVVYHRRGDADRAVGHFTRAIKVAPSSAAAYVNRAEVHISRRDQKKALDDLDRAIQVARDPLDPHARKAGALRGLMLRGARRQPDEFTDTSVAHEASPTRQSLSPDASMGEATATDVFTDD